MTDSNPSRPEYGQPSGEGSTSPMEGNAQSPLGWDDSEESESLRPGPDSREASPSEDWWATGQDPQASDDDQLSGGWDDTAVSESANPDAAVRETPQPYNPGYAVQTPAQNRTEHAYDPQVPAYSQQMHGYAPQVPAYGPQANGYNQFGGEQKSWLAAVLLCLFFGELGVHNFYIGQKQTGTVQLALYGGAFLLFLITFGFGFFLLLPSVIWKFVDLIKLLTGSISTDAQGIPLKR